ncbi:hypothetical protein PMZ80_008278 [Knufia obscura]|uniref:Uncharacterized protein n=2 Tax=Knufia TaxID=430999 RepID=A0AAN8FEN7_9EURO|nr:hypothetical protein PMZ80_008278 [Knufia obscura]KAK5956996.1 hypothetical protein OHC33_001365 [Knufia fluminis]
MQEASKHRPDTSLPEVVPVENLKSNTIRHDDSYYRHPNPTQPFSPLAVSGQGSYSPYTATATTTPYPHQWNDGPTSGVKITQRKSRIKFAALVTLATFIITALAMGAGLGIPLAKSQSKLDPNNYAPLHPSKVVLIERPEYCDSNGRSAGNTLFTTRKGDASFDVKCGTIFQEGLPAFDPTTASLPGSEQVARGTVRNVATIVSYSVDDCMYACASFNNMTENPDPASPKCQGVTFIAALQSAVDMLSGNCFLKNATLFDIGQASVSLTAVSAELSTLRVGT